MADKPISIDMTDAKEIGALDPSVPYVFAISDWTYGEKPGGDPNVAVTLDVVKPSGINQKVFDTINLVNPNTKSRVIMILAATGDFGTKAEIKANTKFQLPTKDKIMGTQIGGRVKTVVDDTGQYSDKSVLRSAFTVDEYDAQVEKAASAAAV